MATAAEINAAFASIPTINVAEVTRIKTSEGEFDAEVALRFVGSTQYVYTDAAGTTRFVRLKD